MLGPQTGLFGILAASLVGGLLPGRPTISVPLAYLAARQGAGDTQLVAMLTAWSAYAFHRILVFEALAMGLLTWLLGITFAS